MTAARRTTARRARTTFRRRRSGTFFQWNGCKCWNCAGPMLGGLPLWMI